MKISSDNVTLDVDVESIEKSMSQHFDKTQKLLKRQLRETGQTKESIDSVVDLFDCLSRSILGILGTGEKDAEHLVSLNKLMTKMLEVLQSNGINNTLVNTLEDVTTKLSSSDQHQQEAARARRLADDRIIGNQEEQQSEQRKANQVQALLLDSIKDKLGLIADNTKGKSTLGKMLDLWKARRGTSVPQPSAPEPVRPRRRGAPAPRRGRTEPTTGAEIPQAETRRGRGPDRQPRQPRGTPEVSTHMPTRGASTAPAGRGIGGFLRGAAVIAMGAVVGEETLETLGSIREAVSTPRTEAPVHPIENVARAGTVEPHAGTVAQHSTPIVSEPRIGATSASLVGEATHAGTGLMGAAAKHLPLIGGAIALGADVASGTDLGEAVGAAAGSTIGATVGATLGSVVPVVGTAIGGIVGGMAGDYLGRTLAKHATEPGTKPDTKTKEKEYSDKEKRLAKMLAEEDQYSQYAKEIQQDKAKEAKVAKLPEPMGSSIGGAALAAVGISSAQAGEDVPNLVKGVDGKYIAEKTKGDLDALKPVVQTSIGSYIGDTVGSFLGSLGDDPKFASSVKTDLKDQMDQLKKGSDFMTNLSLEGMIEEQQDGKVKLVYSDLDKLSVDALKILSMHPDLSKVDRSFINQLIQQKTGEAKSLSNQQIVSQAEESGALQTHWFGKDTVDEQKLAAMDAQSLKAISESTTVSEEGRAKAKATLEAKQQRAAQQAQTAGQTQIENITGEAASKSVQNINQMLMKGVQDDMDRGVKYGYGSKNSATGSIDCSGFVMEQMKGVENQLSDPSLIKDSMKAMKRGAATGGAAGIIQAVGEQTGKELSGKDVNLQNMKEGMVIGIDHDTSGGAKSGAGRYKGIDHITQVVRDPKTGEMMISESSSHKGPHTTKASEWLERNKDKAKYMVDPLANLRGAGEGTEVAAAKASAERAMTGKPDSSVVLEKSAQPAAIQARGGAATESENAKTVMASMMKAGYTKEQAAGFAGNIKAESEFKPSVKNMQGSSAVGIAQWMKPGQAEYRKYSGGKELREASVKEQADFLAWQTTQGSEKGAGAKIKAHGGTASESAEAVQKYFERGGKQGQDSMGKRTGAAEKYAKLEVKPGEGAVEAPVQVAAAETPKAAPSEKKSWAERISPISTAQAEELPKGQPLPPAYKQEGEFDPYAQYGAEVRNSGKPEQPVQGRMTEVVETRSLPIGPGGELLGPKATGPQPIGGYITDRGNGVIESRSMPIGPGGEIMSPTSSRKSPQQLQQETYQRGEGYSLDPEQQKILEQGKTYTQAQGYSMRPNDGMETTQPVAQPVAQAQMPTYPTTAPQMPQVQAPTIGSMLGGIASTMAGAAVQKAGIQIPQMPQVPQIPSLGSMSGMQMPQVQMPQMPQMGGQQIGSMVGMGNIQAPQLPDVSSVASQGIASVVGGIGSMLTGTPEQPVQGRMTEVVETRSLPIGPGGELMGPAGGIYAPRPIEPIAQPVAQAQMPTYPTTAPQMPQVQAPTIGSMLGGIASTMAGAAVQKAGIQMPQVQMPQLPDASSMEAKGIASVVGGIGSMLTGTSAPTYGQPLAPQNASVSASSGFMPPSIQDSLLTPKMSLTAADNSGVNSPNGIVPQQYSNLTKQSEPNMQPQTGVMSGNQANAGSGMLSASLTQDDIGLLLLNAGML